jgi:hypothetical protein
VTTRRWTLAACTLTAAITWTALSLAAQSPADSGAVISQARQALGGEAKLSAIKSFVATGRTRQVRGETLVPIEFEIACELPDRYVRRDEIPVQESGPTSTGFNGDGLIQFPPPPPPPPAAAQAAAPGGAASAGPPPPAGAGRRAGAPPSPEAARLARVNTVKQDFAKLTLGMFAASFDGYPLTFTVAGRAESPQGTADVLDVKAAGNFSIRLFVSTDTHLPLMVSWTTPVLPANIVLVAPGQSKPATLAPGAIVVEAPVPPDATAAQADKDAYAKAIQDLRAKTIASAKPIANYLYYSDYRDAGGGVLFPFRLRKAIGADTIEQTDFDGFKLNAHIDAKKFEVVK